MSNRNKGLLAEEKNFYNRYVIEQISTNFLDITTNTIRKAGLGKFY
ncbi:hypothetical protein [Candidatus Profftia sp. (ex Adelges kitamiensis)]|nr:hypothetical protein [Candidatus Profftia sp. (ex Adelges kitamiensis)]